MLYTSAVIGDNTLKALNSFRRNNVFCDIVITVQGQKFPAHKAVLAANSQYLRQCLLKQNVSTFNLNLQLTNAKNFEDVLEFLYTCKLEINESKLAEVLMIGTFLQISEISNLTSKFMASLHNQDCTKSEALPIEDEPADVFCGNSTDRQQQLVDESLQDEFPSVSFVTSTCESQDLSPTTNDLPQAFIRSPSTSGDNVSSSSNRNIIEIESLEEFPSSSENRSPGIFTEPARVTFPISPFESAAKRKRSAPRKVPPIGQSEVISDDNIYACHGCYAPFENHKDFLSHQCNTLTCKFCGHQSKSRPCLVKHERTHTIDRIYWCPICQANFTRRDSLKEHLLKRSNGLCGHKMMEMNLDVDGILKGCKNPQNFEQVTLLEEAHFQCEHCRDRFSSFGAMELHCKQVHEISIDKRCPICGLVFKQDLWFNNHLEYHSLYPVEMHSADSKSEIYRFMCQLCEKQFTSEVEYGVHKAKNCRDKCRYCPFVCNLKVHLERHVRTHTGERPYLCFECNKSYMRRDNLLTHLKTKHQMQMPKFCRLEQQPTVVRIRGSEIKILTNQIDGSKHLHAHPNNSDTEAYVNHSRSNLQETLPIDAF